MPKTNYASVGAGALSGAGTGALIGSAAPGIGTATGAAIGGIGGGLLGFLGGQEENKLKKLSNYDPNQQQIHNQTGEALQGGGGIAKLIAMLQDMINPDSEYHKAYEDQQMGQFNEVTLPNIGERFAGAGANSGALSSSGFGQALGGAAAGLQRDLAVNKRDVIMRALQALQSQYQNYQQQKPFDYYEKPGSAGLVESAIPGIAQGVGQAIPGMIAGK